MTILEVKREEFSPFLCVYVWKGSRHRFFSVSGPYARDCAPGSCCGLLLCNRLLFSTLTLQKKNIRSVPIH